MKTKDEWDESDLNLSDYLTEPCEIDEGLYLYIGEIVAPSYCTPGLIQCGEADRQEPAYYQDDPIMFRKTVSEVNGKYFYLGILPEFKQ